MLGFALVLKYLEEGVGWVDVDFGWCVRGLQFGGRYVLKAYYAFGS